MKWAGGKSDSLGFINEVIGDIKGRLIEPFAGSAVVSLNIDAFGYVIADVNEDLIKLFNLIKREKGNFIEYCEGFFTEKNNTEERYYELRDRFNETNREEERAALFIYLNRHSFNGLCRYNNSGKYNVPFGRHKRVGFPKKELYFFAFRAEYCEFYNQDFEYTIMMAKPEDVVYCDPPYVPLTDTAYFADYTAEGFGLEEQKRLVRLAETSKCKFLISNHFNDVTKELYKNANDIKTRPVGRYISGKAESRKPVEELLAIYNK